jgi:hypothetical protein
MNKLLKVSIPILLILGSVLITGCAAPAEVLPVPTPVPAPSLPKGVVDEGGYPDAVPEEPTEERKIVKTGYITLEVEDIAASMDKVANMADEMGGYVVSSDKREYETGVSGSIRIRVPSQRFEEAFERLRQFAVAVPYENTEAKDVTEEYVDLEARLRNLEATEAQYLALLEKAEEVEDMLMVQRELSNVREEIERIEGRMLYLERTSDMALIEINLQETKGLAAPWSASSALKTAVRGLTAFGRGLATLFIWLGVFCWVWIPPLVIWLRRRRRAKS